MDDISRAIELDELSQAIGESSQKLRDMEVEFSKLQQRAERAKRERRALTAKVDRTWTHRCIVFATTFFSELLKDHHKMDKADLKNCIYAHTDDDIRDFAKQCYEDFREDFTRYNAANYGKDIEDFISLQVMRWRNRHC